jgi:hypothetical protein
VTMQPGPTSSAAAGPACPGGPPRAPGGPAAAPGPLAYGELRNQTSHRVEPRSRAKPRPVIGILSRNAGPRRAIRSSPVGRTSVRARPRRAPRPPRAPGPRGGSVSTSALHLVTVVIAQGGAHLGVRGVLRRGGGEQGGGGRPGALLGVRLRRNPLRLDLDTPW